MVADSPVKFECEYYSTLRLPGNPPMGSVDVIIGKVVAVHIKDEVLTDGILDVKKTKPIARCGYYQYTVVKETFEMVSPATTRRARMSWAASRAAPVSIEKSPSANTMTTRRTSHKCNNELRCAVLQA
ncbi:FMN-binding split barrel [Phytophthora cactorum]|nr:FMN-binding split barrel [Phytophthora cactorum]